MQKDGERLNPSNHPGRPPTPHHSAESTTLMSFPVTAVEKAAQHPLGVKN